MHPTMKIALSHPRVDFEEVIPRQFGEWLELPNATRSIPDPVQTEALARFYSQTVSRTYANRRGYRIMLSLAYGEEQTDSMRVHSPEVCYPAQGFEMSRPFVKWIAISEQRIPVTQVVATQGSRVEPLTYFISVGDRVVEPNTSRKIAQLSYGLKGQIPDGLLVRVSSIDAETDKAFEIQKDFLLSLHGSLNAEKRQAVFGTP
jgi:EpsI family protein